MFKEFEEVTIFAANKDEAWRKIKEISPCEFAFDLERTKLTGVSTYFSTSEDVLAWVDDFGILLVVNLPKFVTVNVWACPEEVLKSA